MFYRSSSVFRIFYTCIIIFRTFIFLYSHYMKKKLINIHSSIRMGKHPKSKYVTLIDAKDKPIDIFLGKYY